MFLNSTISLEGQELMILLLLFLGPITISLAVCLCIILINSRINPSGHKEQHNLDRECVGHLKDSHGYIQQPHTHSTPLNTTAEREAFKDLLGKLRVMVHPSELGRLKNELLSKRLLNEEQARNESLSIDQVLMNILGSIQVHSNPYTPFHDFNRVLQDNINWNNVRLQLEANYYSRQPMALNAVTQFGEHNQVTLTLVTQVSELRSDRATTSNKLHVYLSLRSTSNFNTPSHRENEMEGTIEVDVQENSAYDVHVDSQTPGELKLKLNLHQPNTEYSFSFRLTSLSYSDNRTEADHFQCQRAEVTIRTPPSIVTDTNRTVSTYHSCQEHQTSREIIGVDSADCPPEICDSTSNRNKHAHGIGTDLSTTRREHGDARGTRSTRRLVLMEGTTTYHRQHSERNQQSNNLNGRNEYQICRQLAHVHMEYTNELKGTEFDTTCGQFRQAIFANNWRETLCLKREITEDPNRTVVEKAFFMCYHVLALINAGKMINATREVEEVASLTRQNDSDNMMLVRGRAERIMADISIKQDNPQTAKYHIDNCKEALKNAKPSCEKGCMLVKEANILLEMDCRERNKEYIEQLLKDAFENSAQCTDEHRREFMIPMVLLERAVFYTGGQGNSWTSVTKTDDELSNAYKCLEQFSAHSKILGEQNIYQLKFLTTQSDYYRHRHKYKEAHDYISQAEALQRADVLNGGKMFISEKLFFLTKKLQ